MKRRILSIITALALCLSLCPTWALAAEADPSLCRHHPKHTEDCGYTAPTEGHDCGHRHTAECYTKGILPDADSGDPYQVGGDTENLLDCHHSHDSDCGYVQADPGAPCGYVCHICPIEDLIAALPEQVTEDNADDVRAQLDHILDLYRELDEGEQGQLDLSRIYALQGALDAANDPDMIEGEVSVTYQEASWNGSEVTYTGKTENCTSVEGSTEAVTWDAGWYVVNSTVTIDQPITVTGAVNLILADGCTLNAEKGIVVETGNSLTIYAQSVGTGTLNATGTDSAGIGGAGRTDYGVDGGSSGAITIHGGNITATSQNGAGIGGGAPYSGAKGGSGSNITIYGGSVTASSSRNGMGGAGIGGGGGDTGGGTGENINIYGGTVNATGGYMGAGIGGGGSGIGRNDDQSLYKSGDGSGITISGGSVTAVGGNYAAGIGGGGGYYSSYTWGGTTYSNGCTGGAGSITITGGIVDASSPTDVSSSDYKGAPIGNGGNAGDTAATVSKTNAIVFENGAGTVYGDVTLDGSYTVPGDYTLNIPAGASLSGSGTLSGGGTFTTENLTADMISVPTNLYYNGEDRTEYLTTELSGELTKGVTICGQTFTVSGWTLAVEKAADSDLTYTATYTNDSDNTKTVQKTITLLQSGTKFEGGIKTYNGETETTSFTAGDTITVKATPTPTGDAPQKAAARLRADPTEGQMVVYVGTTQVSVPADKGEDGTYTMEVSAADVLLAAGGPGTGITLTAKFVGNDNMADGAGTVKVNITAVAKAERGGNVIDYFGVSDFEGTNNLFCQEAYADATITLLGDVQPGTNSDAGTTCSTMVDITCTLDLAGHNFTSTDTAIYVLPMGNLTIQDSSTGKTGNVSFIKSDGTLTLYGGTFGKIETAYTLSSLLAENCAYYRGSTPILLSELEGQKTLDGTVTVQECQHTGVEATNNGDGTHSVNCPYCGFENAAEPHSFNETGYCPACRLQAAAKVEKDGSDTVYVEASGLADVFKDSGNAGATVTLLSDVALSQTVTISGGQFTLSGNGHTITYTGDGAAIQIASGTVTLSDCKIDGKQCGVGVSDGTVKLSGCTITAAGDENGGGQGVYISGGDVTISGGTYSGKGGYAACGVEIQSGKLTIESGTFSGADGDRACGVNVGQNGKATIRDGSFSGTGGYDASGLRVLFGGNAVISGGVFTGSYYGVYNTGTTTISGGTFTGDTNPLYSNASLAGMLATGCAYYRDDKPIEVDNGLSPGTVTVQECQHTGVEVTDLGNGKHGLDCPYCGYHSEHTTALTATASGNAVTLSEGCATCEYKKELGTVGFTFENLVYGNPDAKVTFTNIPANYILMCQDNQRDDGMTEVSWTLAELFNSTKVTAGKHNMKVSFVNAANIYSNECELPFTVAKAPLMAVIDATNGSVTKPYDGTTAAPEGLAITLTGLVEGDDVTATASYAYDNANAGERTITATSITLTGADAGNYTLSSTTATTTGTITKSQPAIAFASGYDPSKTYDGQTIPNPAADNLTITGAAFGNVDFTWSATPKNAGTYTLTASIPVTDNTEAASATLAVTISSKAVTPTITITPSGYEYTGSAIHPSGSAVKVMDGDTVIPDSEYTLSYGENTQVGTGSVTVTDKENGNYEIAQTTETFTITAKPLTGAKVEVTGTFTYTGNALTPAPTVTLDGKTLTENTDYTVAYDKNTDAGTATITVTGKGNYSGTAQGTFTIGRATLTADGTGTASGIYGDKLSELTVSGLTAKLGEATVTGTWKLAGGTVPNVGDSGEYTATFTPATGADNYNALEAKVTLNIAKANYTGTTTASTSAKFGTTGTYDLSALLPDGATVETAATTSNIFEGTPSVSDKTLTYKLKAGATVGSTGPITVPVTSANYNNFNLTITVTVTAKDVPTLTVSPITVTYTGEAVPGTAIKGTAKVGSTTVPGTWAFASGEAVTNVADSGTKTVKFVPTDGTNYAEATATVVVTINKATPTGAPKYTAISTSGKTLADAGLTTEGSTLKPAGTVAWVLGTDTAVTANTQYEWTFTPTDTANYNTLTGKITLWPYTTPVNPGGGGGYVPSGPGGSSLPVTTTGQGSSTVTTTTTAAPTASVGNGTATTTINTAMGNEIVKQAVANNSETVVIAPSVTGSVTKAEVSIPASTVGQIGSQTSASLTVSTPVADVTIPNGGLGSLSSAGGTVTVTAEQVGNSVELSVTAGGRTVQNVPGGVTLTVPAANTTPGTVAVLVHEDGTREVVRKSVADNGTVTIPLDGSAKLEIVDNSKYFADVPATSWAADAVAFASSHELFNGTSSTQFSPEQPMSRGMLAVVLHNLESNPTQALTGAFTDVDNSQWYAEGVAWAEAQGIIGGYGNGQFGPNDNITREQLAVMLWRYAGSPAATDRELHFADAHRASDWALDALRWATEKGIINGKGGGILDPTGQATRAETAQMLKNFMEDR